MNFETLNSFEPTRNLRTIHNTPVEEHLQQQNRPSIIDKVAIYLNAHCRTDSPFSWDKTLVLLPSLTSHKMTVPSTDADAKAAPLNEKWEF